ncbi:MAG: T9SS type A sorting domain-containing protein [Bacteroidales bacterium]|nr:T9SS type A sorting domain-containing protein [Bacteroidales bacterium]
MKKFISVIVIISLLFASENVFSQKTWTGTTSTAWNTATNWSPSGVPAASDNVSIPSAPVNQPLISGVTGVCQNLTVNSGATLTISGSITNSATLTASGTATFNGALSIGGYGVTANTGKLVAGNVIWNSTAVLSAFYGSRMELSGNWEFTTGSSVAMGLCWVTFTGTTSSTITNNSAGSNFGTLTLNKTGGAAVYIGASSTSTLTISSGLTIGTGATLIGQPNITTILKGNLVNSGNIYMNAGTLSFEKSSGTQEIQINTNDYFYSVKVNSDGTIALATSYYMQLKGSLTIQKGIFDPAGKTVALWGDWINSVGAGAFIEGTGTVIFNGGDYHQYCSNETFHNLEVNKTLGGSLRMNGTTVACAQYDWTAGSVDLLNSGTFTAFDLLDDGIFGNYYCNTGCTINLSNYGGNIDLRGNLYIYGGNFNVYGGNNPSWWPYLSNSSVTMSGGVLNFADQGILIRTDPTYTFTNNITGGTIKTAKDFTNGRTDFNPTAGTVELYGSVSSNLTMSAGNLFNLTINKTAANTVTLATNATVNGILTVQSGTFQASNKILFTGGNISINNDGTLWLENGSILRITGSRALTVDNGGVLKAIGLTGSKVLITNNGATGSHEFHVNGTISAKYAIFEYNYGINIWSTATIDPLYPFDQCTFQYGVDRFLLISNSQEVTIRDANFPTAPVYNNVWKNNNAGRVTFRDATGTYAGAAYENDPYGRIDWIVTQPGLWTGAVSTNWHTAGNWDDLAVPTSVTNVTIPATAPNMPVISVNAFCNNLTLAGTLIVGNAIFQVGGNVAISGNLAMNNASGQMIIQGDVNWNSGSTATFTASSVIHAYGHWNFNAGANANLASGTVFFKGTTTKYIRSYSSSCSFSTLVSSKTGGAVVGLSDFSTQPLTVNGILRSDAGSPFISSSQHDLVVKSSVISNGALQCDAGAVRLAGTSQYILPNVNDYFNHLVFSQSGTVTINNTYTNSLNIKGDLHIDSGIFEAGSNIIFVGGNWNNSAGTAGFVEGSSRVIFNSGAQHQLCSTETFNQLEVNKANGKALRMQGGTVSCNEYDWTAGAVDVLTGSFSASILTDQGIAGNFYVNTGGAINLGGLSGFGHLKGNLYIYGGAINVLCGIPSEWGNANSSITMSGGELNVYPYGIEIVNNPSYTFTTNITGGTIRTQGSFENHRSDFMPTAGTVELYGSGNSGLNMYTGSLWGLTINKSVANSVSMVLGAVVNNTLTVQSGIFKVSNAVLATAGNIAVNNGGTLWMDLNSQLKVASTKTLNVNSGGLLKVLGTSGNEPVLTRNGASGYYNLIVNNGGTISARRASFYYMNAITVNATATVDLANPFDYCTFRYGGSGGMLTLNNSQDLTIRNAIFLMPASGYNVSKGVNAGNVVMKDASGDFSGELYENDFYLRVQWTASQPGLWTGAVSTNWHTAGNWDDLAVPTAVTNVTIPTGVPNMPIISAAAGCNSLTVNGNLTIGNAAVLVGGGMLVAGNLAMVSTLSRLIIQGDVFWIAGSTASSSAGAEIEVYGHWNFNEGANFQPGAGSVIFKGTITKDVRVYAAGCSFWNLVCSKTGGAYLLFSDPSTQPLSILGSLQTDAGAKFVSTSALNIIVKGNIISNGTIQCDAGSLFLDGATQSVTPNTNDYFNHLVFSQTGTVTINNTYTNILNVKGDLHIDSGVFNAGSNIIKVGGHWDNNVGTAAFSEGTSRVVFNGGNYHQYCQTNETFNILEVDKPLGGALRMANGSVGKTVVCNQYDWTAGALDALNGSFTAYDLADIDITGNYYVNPGGTINLTNNGGFVSLSGYLHIFGGTFNVWGAYNDSFWPGFGDAGIEMSGGILDFHDCGISIHADLHSFTESITGGTIRTSKGFLVDGSDFTPEGGTIEFYGTEVGVLNTANGGYVNNVVIQKSFISGMWSGIIYVSDVADINGDVLIQSGVLSANTGTIYVAGDWNNLVGDAGFDEGIRKVVFDGDGPSDLLSPEIFYDLEVNKTYGFSDGLEAFQYNQQFHVTNNLHIIDGTMKLSYGTDLFVNGDFTIDFNAGMNTYASARLHIGKNWTNANTSSSETAGFYLGHVTTVGNYTVVTFNGTTDQILTSNCPEEGFRYLKIDKPSGTFRPNTNIRSYNYVNILNGGWEDNIDGLTHYFHDDFIVYSTGAFFSSPLNTVEFLGQESSVLSYLSTTGSFHNLVINKGADDGVIQNGNVGCLFGGNLTVENGTYNLNGNNLWVEGDLTVNDDGVLSMPAASLLTLTNNNSLSVNTGGRIEIAGTSGSNATIRADVPTARYAFNVNSGSTIAADNGLFKNMDANGINVKSGAIIDPAHAFKGCTFQDGVSGGTLLRINNSQEINILNATFPANTWGGASNVSKTVSNGHVYFMDYTGPFSGEAFDNDAFDRITWVPVNTTATGTVVSPNSVCFDATNTITVAGGGTTFVVQAGASATMIAGVKISFLYGTTVLPGGYMHGYITTTNNYCGGLPKAMVATVYEGGEQEGEELANSMLSTSMFAIYPNPASVAVTVFSKDVILPGKVQVEMYDLRGDRIFSASYTGERKHEFTLNGLPPGLYFVKLATGDRVESFKLVVMR